MNNKRITSLSNRITFYLIAFFSGVIVLPAMGGVGLVLMIGAAACLASRLN